MPGAGYVVDQWQTEDGLPQNSVTSIAQTRSGYLWLGTFNGLVRFDGIRFTVFDPSTTPELPSSRILRLLTDKRGRLWITSEYADLTVFQEDKFESLRAKVGPVAYVVEDQRGDVWLHRETFLEKFGGKDRISLSVKDKPEFGWIRDIIRGPEGQFWVNRKFGAGFSTNGLFEFSRGPYGGSAVADQLFAGRDGSLWLAIKAEGLVRYQRGQRIQTLPLPVPNADVKAFVEDSAGNLWVGTVANGVFRYGKDEQWTVFNTTNGLSHDSIRTIFEDAESNIWIGTDGGGLNRLKRTGFRMRATGIGVALSVAEDSQRNLVVSFNGEGIRREEVGQFKPLVYLPCFDEKTPVWAVGSDRAGDLWTGDLDGGLVKIHDGGFERIRFSGRDPLLYLRAIYGGSDGSIWAGHIKGLLRLFNGKYETFDHNNGLPVEDVRVCTEDNRGRLVAGLNGGGLARFEAGRFTSFGRTNGLIDERVWSLYGDSNGVVWVGTFGSGLSRFADDRFFNYRQALPVKVVTSIVEDFSGNLWLGSLKGLFRVSRSALDSYAQGKSRTLPYQQYDKSDGLSSAECSGGMQPACLRTADRKLLFSTLKGVVELDPRRLPFNRKPPNVIVEEARIDERPLILSGGQVLNVPPGRSRVEFIYTALSFTAAEKIRFKYQLEGLDKDWIDAGGRRSAPYMNVPPGNYRFRVAACNNDGVWNETGAALAVVMQPFYWQTYWFRFASGVGGAGLVMLLFWREIRRLNRQRAAQQDISRRLIQSQEQERKRIAGELHDSLGQNLQLIKNRLSLVGQQPDPGAAKRDLEEISAIAAAAIGEMRAISYALRPVELEQVGLTRSMESLIQKVADASQMRFLSELDNVDHLLSPDMEMNFYRILQETLNNAVKHSRAAEVIVEIKRQTEGVRLSVFDDGVGVQQPGESGEPLHLGLGMASMKERALILGGKLEVKSARGKGMRVTLIVPVAAGT